MAGLSAQVNVRIPEAEYRTLSAEAEARGLTLGVFLRQAGMAAAANGTPPRPPESRSSDPGAAPRVRATGSPDGVGKDWRERSRSPVASTPVAKGGMHANRSIDTAPSPEQIVAESSVPLSAKPNGREAIVADLRAKVEAVGKGLQGSGTTLSDEPEVLDSNCAHPKAKVVQGASGVAVKVCPDCGERGL